MTKWKDAVKDGSNPWDKLDDKAGTGASLPGQGDLSDEERTAYKEGIKKYTDAQGEALKEHTGGHFTKVNDKMTSSAMIMGSYELFKGGNEGREEYIKAAQNAPIGDMKDPGERLKTLSMLTTTSPTRTTRTSGRARPPAPSLRHPPAAR